MPIDAIAGSVNTANTDVVAVRATDSAMLARPSAARMFEMPAPGETATRIAPAPKIGLTPTRTTTAQVIAGSRIH
jgi:hypothetical protein